MKTKIYYTALLLILLNVFACMADTPKNFVAEQGQKDVPAEKVVKETEDGSELEKIVSGREELPLLEGHELSNHIHDSLQKIQGWFNRESDILRAVLTVSCIVIFLGGSTGWILHICRKRNQKRNSSLGIRLFFAIANPVLCMIVLSIIFVLFLPVLKTVSELYVINVRVFFTILTLLGMLTALRLIGVFSDRMASFALRDDNNLDVLMVDIARKVLMISIVSVALLFIGQTIFNLNITTLLAGAGVVGLAVAFASRETLANFFGTLVIIMDAPFRCGDRIRIGNVDGIVEEIGMRSSKIRTESESLVIIPNSQIAASNVEKISRRGKFRLMFTIGLTYQTASEKMLEAIRILHEITDNFHGMDAPGFAPHIYFESFGASSLEIRVILWLKTESFPEEEKMRTEINRAILQRFTENGLEFAYNTVTNIISGDPQHPLAIQWEKKVK